MARSPRLRPAGARGIRPRLGLFAAVALALLGGLLQPASAATLDVGFRDHSYGPAVSPTAEKPQSKLWHAGGRWWGVLWDPAAKRYTIHGFNLATQATNAWTSTGVTVDQRPHSQADALWDGQAQKLYVLTHLKSGVSTADKGMRVQRFGFSGGVYQQELVHTVANAQVESASLDKDSTGRLWVTYTASVSGGRLVMVAHTTTGDSAWTAPSVLPVDAEAALTSSDDISTVVAYGDTGGRRIGVLWSNQRTSSIYFASHADGAPTTSWTMTTICRTSMCPDDHLNIKSVDADASGHVYAVVKTSLNDKSPRIPDDPLIVVYRLSPSGGWSSSTAWTVGEGNMTRPLIVLDSQNRQAHAFAAPCCSGGAIYRKQASFDDFTFPRGNGTVFMRSAVSTEKINNPTSTKQTVNGSTGLLVLAGMNATREYVHNFLPLDGSAPPPQDTTPPTVVSRSPVSGGTDVPLSTTVTATFSEPLDPGTVSTATVRLTDETGATVLASVSYDDAARRVSLDPVDDLGHGEHTVRISGGASGVKDPAGNALTADAVWSFTTVEPPTASETVTVPVDADTWVSSAAPEGSFGAGSVLGVDGSPQDTAYLRFDLRPYAGRTLQDAVLRIRVTTSPSKGTQVVRPVADDSWSESEMTYLTRPAMGPELGRLGPTLRNTDYAVPLDLGEVAGEVGQVLSLGIDSTHRDGVELASRETGTPPRLELTFGVDGGDLPPPDTEPPTVTGTSPSAGQTGVASSATVTATFSEPMDASTLTASSVTLRDDSDAAVAGAVSYDSATRQVSLDPAAGLVADTTYTARVEGGASGVADTAGNRLAADHVWTFRTAAVSEGPTTVSVPATADTYVSASAPTRSFGGAAMINVDAADPVAIGYLRFDLSGHAGRAVQSAALEVRVTTSGSKGTQVVRPVADSSWSESGLTYENRPALGATELGRLGPTVTNTTYTVPLEAPALEADLGGPLTLGLDTTHTDGVDLGTREAGWPTTLKLVLE